MCWGWESARKGTLWVVKRQSRQNNRENEKRNETGYPTTENTNGSKAKANREYLKHNGQHRECRNISHANPCESLRYSKPSSVHLISRSLLCPCTETRHVRSLLVVPSVPRTRVHQQGLFMCYSFTRRASHPRQRVPPPASQQGQRSRRRGQPRTRSRESSERRSAWVQIYQHGDQLTRLSRRSCIMRVESL